MLSLTYQLYKYPYVWKYLFIFRCLQDDLQLNQSTNIVDTNRYIIIIITITSVLREPFKRKTETKRQFQKSKH